MQRSLNACVHRYELIASRDGTHVIVIAANGHNQQVEDAIFATAERPIATRDSAGPRRCRRFTSTYDCGRYVNGSTAADGPEIRFPSP